MSRHTQVSRHATYEHVADHMTERTRTPVCADIHRTKLVVVVNALKNFHGSKEGQFISFFENFWVFSDGGGGG